MISTDEARRITERFEIQQGKRSSRRNFEKEFWERFVLGCVHWRTGKPIQLYPYQIDALKKIWGNQRTLLHFGRQVGKTMLCALYLAFMSRWKPNPADSRSQLSGRSVEVAFALLSVLSVAT